MGEQVRPLPPTPQVAPLNVPSHDSNTISAASPKLRSTQSLISPRGQTLNSPGRKNPELSRIAALVGTFAAMEQQNSNQTTGSHPNQPPVPTKKAPPIPNRPKSITVDHGVVNNPTLSPSSNTPKVAAKGPLPKRPSHAPPPPPKSVNGAPVAPTNSNNEDESSSSDSNNNDSNSRNLGPSSDGSIAGNLSPRRKNAQSEANIKRPLVRKTTGPPRVFQSRVQNALAASEQKGNDKRSTFDETISPRSANSSPTQDRKSRRMSVSGLASPR